MWLHLVMPTSIQTETVMRSLSGQYNYFIESVSSIPAVEFSGTPHAVSLPFLTLPMSEAAFLLSF